MASDQLHKTGTISERAKILWNAPGAKVRKVTRLSNNGLIDFINSAISTKHKSKDPFYVLDSAVVKTLMGKWNHSIPNVKPFYAVKCNPEPAFINMLYKLGAGFDCASKSEIETVLALGVPADEIVFANPCKVEAHIEYAARAGVNLTTYDSLNEVEKIRKWHPKCALLLRIKAGEDAEARCPLGTKYGAFAEEVHPFLQAAHAAQLRVVGVSFHVGSAVMHPQAYDTAIKAAKAVFDTALQLGMPEMNILNIGGGFSVGPQFENICKTVKSAIASYFGNQLGLKLIAEPGRFLAEESFTLITNIIGKRVRGSVREYWINDGVYGSLNCIINGHAVLNVPFPLVCKGPEKMYQSTIFGPTCSALDTIFTDYPLPELQVGDWLVFPNIVHIRPVVGAPSMDLTLQLFPHMLKQGRTCIAP